MKPIIYDGDEYTAHSPYNDIEQSLQAIESIHDLFDYCNSLTDTKGGLETDTGGYIEFINPDTYRVLVTIEFSKNKIA